jgi:hypothetical protein
MKTYYAIDLHFKTTDGEELDFRDHDAIDPVAALDYLKNWVLEEYPTAKFTKVRAWKIQGTKVTQYRKLSKLI